MGQNGAIRARDLIEGVSDQVRGIICSLVAWENGTYDFEEGPLPSREVIVLRISTADLLMDGIRRVERWSRIRSAIGDLSQRYALSQNAAAIMSSLPLDKDEFGWYEECIQCGYTRDIPLDVPLDTPFKTDPIPVTVIPDARNLMDKWKHNSLPSYKPINKTSRAEEDTY